MNGTIALRGIEVFAFHGVFDHERAEGQTFLIDVEIVVDVGAAVASDDVADTIDYGELTEAIVSRVTSERWNLIESVAAAVLDVVFGYETVTAATATVHKPDAPIPVRFDDVAVTLNRQR